MSDLPDYVRKELFDNCSVVVPFVTPVIEGKVSPSDISAVVRQSMNLGARAGLALGETGEGRTIPEDEYRIAADAFMQAGKYLDFPIIINITGNTNEQTIERLKFVKELGPAAILFAPMVGGAVQERAAEYLLSNTPKLLPVYQYNNPGAFGASTPEELLISFAESPRITFVGEKDSSCDERFFCSRLELAKRYGFIMQTGDELCSKTIGEHPNFRGVVSSGGQLRKYYVDRMTDPDNRHLQSLARVCTFAYSDQRHAGAAGTKYALKLMNVISSEEIFEGTKPFSQEARRTFVYFLSREPEMIGRAYEDRLPKVSSGHASPVQGRVEFAP